MKKLFISIGVCILAISLAIGAFFLINHITGDKIDEGTTPETTVETKKDNKTTTVVTTTEETKDPDSFQDENVDDKGWT